MVRNVDDYGALVGDEPIAARTVLWAAGMIGTPIARSLGVTVDRHGLVPVTPLLNPPGRPNVFVIGDTALVVGSDAKPVPGIASAAKQEGAYVARLLIRRLTGKQPPAAFHYRTMPGTWRRSGANRRSWILAGFV